MRSTKAVAYVRVSTREQADGGVSLEAQERAVRAYAEARGLDLGTVFVEAGASAGSVNRPQLAAMLDAVRAGGIGAVIVSRLDRLTRRQRDLWNLLDTELEPHGVALVSVSEAFDTGTPTGRAMLGMLGVFAELERETLRERTRSGMAEVKAQGRHVGRTPFGWDSVEGEPGVLAVNESEQAVIRLAEAMRGQGLSFRRVADLLNAGGNVGRGGGKWTHRSVARVLEREAVAA